VKPQFVEKITTYDGKTVSTFEPEILNTVEMPDEYWDVVQRGMERVTQQGFDGFPYKLASKTGTAESDTSAGRVENAVFIAYAPADNPKLAVAVVVPEGGYGAWGAAPIARAIFDAYDRSIGLTDEEQSP
jgi:penicillin-binding protein 2